MSVRESLDEMSVGIGGPSKIDFPPQCVCVSPSPLRACTEQQVEEGGTSFLPRSSALELRFTPSAAMVLRAQIE